MRFKYSGPDGTTFPTILHDGGTWVANDGDVIELDTDPGHVALEETDEPVTVDGGRHADVETTHVDEPAEGLAAPVEAFATGGVIAGDRAVVVGESVTAPNPDPDQE